MQQTKRIYLDYNATAPLLPEVKNAIHSALDLIGNPSSVHSFGRKIRKDIEESRHILGRYIGCDPTFISFTSGATEANNWVLKKAPVQSILVSALEHSSIYDVAKNDKRTTLIPITPDGIVDLVILESMLQQALKPALVCVMWVNNETGIIQPIEAISELCQRYEAWLHVDAVQALGRLKINLHDIPITSLALSAHKIGGPSGCGALIYGHDVILPSFLEGGGQERRRRAGTENTLGIIGFGAAVATLYNTQDMYQQMAQWRHTLEEEILKATPDAQIIGRDSPRVGNTLQVLLPNTPAETQLMSLDLAGIAVSSGSACSSGSIRPSHVLLNMGYPESLARCAIRLSMGVETTEDDLKCFLSAWVVNSQRSKGF